MDQNNSIKYIFRLTIFGLLILAFSFYSCRKNKDLHWDSDLLVPVLTSSLDVWDIFGDTNVVENVDQSLKLILEEQIEMLNPDKVIQVHDTLSAEVFNIPLYLQYAPGDQLIDRINSVTMDVGDMELTLARARIATMKFYVTNTITQPLRVKYEMISSSKNGQSFSVIEDVEPDCPQITYCNLFVKGTCLGGISSSLAFGLLPSNSNNISSNSFSIFSTFTSNE